MDKHLTSVFRWSVACICAEWCKVCRDYRKAFEQLALQKPDMNFRWLDVEDDASITDDLDVETFPTLVVCDGKDVRFFGPVLPNAAVLSRLLTSLQSTDPSNETREPSAEMLAARLRMLQGAQSTSPPAALQDGRALATATE